MVHRLAACRARPLAQVNKYPRIANMLAPDWNRSAACRGYFVDLRTDGRGIDDGAFLQTWTASGDDSATTTTAYIRPWTEAPTARLTKG